METSSHFSIINWFGSIFGNVMDMQKDYPEPMSDLKYMFYAVLVIGIGGIVFLLYTLY